MKIVLAADEAAGVKALRNIDGHSDELVAVFASRPADTGRFGVSVAGLADKLGYDVLPSEALTSGDLADFLRARHVDVLLNVHSLYVIHEDVLRAPRVGSFNLHPGPLPAYAGLNAPSWAVFFGEQRHAVTLHWMEAGIDTGAIVDETWFDLDDESTGLSVSTACVRYGIPLIDQLLETARYEPAAIPARKQDLAERRLFKRADVPFGGRLPWDKSASEILRFVRACDYHPLASPWGYPRTSLDESPLCIRRARPAPERVSGEPGRVVGITDRDAWIGTGSDVIAVEQVAIRGEILPASAVLSEGMKLA